ncbi:hypothetical protein [Sphingomonas sp. SUN039]|uniref:hypothetical protein n=1 Tax=Sphingomonas sp. SUN039 TaxID=2937787 RepID=UPI00216410D9|nr:hypothetical protein [Sphingomonas sp. SUN039]UVO53573.1 hypothetical protein M0209_05360 [Sphingomonas sp. SUN039]
MGRTITIALACAAFAASPVLAGTKAMTASGYALPKDKPVTIVLMRPDTDVGELAAGGLPQPNADWTKAARANIAEALRANGAAKKIEFKFIDEQSGDAAQLMADYTALHKSVADAIIVHKYYGAKLPTKKGKFDWTMGPGAQRIGDLSGGNYALFLYTRDNFASASRKGMQVAGMLGCIVGFCVIVTGGQHVAYASLVELSSGNVVWFNVLRGSKGDIREKPGAQGMIDSIMASMPTQPGEAPKAEVAAK